jgi:ATP-dependent Clp protease ATP-binding subunit ClpA
MHGYNFTERVRKVLALAREEAVRLNHEYVGTEHMLLGLIREGQGVAAATLIGLGVDLEELAERIDATVKRGKTETGPDLPYTSRAKKSLELAMTEARDLNHSYVGTEHLLLGLIREEKGIAAQVIIDVSGRGLEEFRAEVLRLLGTEPVSPGRLTERRLWAKTAATFDEADSGDGPSRGARRLQSLPPAEWVTDRARAVIGRARAEAANRRSRHIEPEHLLIALLQEDGGMAATVLAHLDTDRTALARAAAGAVEETLATDDPFDLKIPYSATAESALRHAFQAARKVQDRRVGTDHLLLGLLLEDSAPASKLLTDAGLSAETVSAERARIAV